MVGAVDAASVVTLSRMGEKDPAIVKLSVGLKCEVARRFEMTSKEKKKGLRGLLQFNLIQSESQSYLLALDEHYFSMPEIFEFQNYCMAWEEGWLVAV